MNFHQNSTDKGQYLELVAQSGNGMEFESTLCEKKISGWRVLTDFGKLPTQYKKLSEGAKLVEEFDVEDGKEGAFHFVAASSIDKKTNEQFPDIVIAQSYDPGEGFHPNILIAPETNMLFVGAGNRLLAYDLEQLTRIWEDYTYSGFWHWHQHDEVVLMSAETELVAWVANGDKLWSIVVQQPWDFRVKNRTVKLDVMGRKSTFDLHEGPTKQDISDLGHE